MVCRNRLLAATLLTTLLLCCCFQANAQVTFSRDWKAGKRSVDSGSETDCGTGLQSATALCHMLISELRTITACEAMGSLRRHAEDVADALYPPLETSLRTNRRR